MKSLDVKFLISLPASGDIKLIKKFNYTKKIAPS